MVYYENAFRELKKLKMESARYMSDVLLKHLVSKNVMDEHAKIHKLNKGGSGASIFEINGAYGDFILKNYDMEAIQKLGEKEYNFYTVSNNFNLKYLPKVIYTEKHNTLGLLILLKKYRDIAVAEWDLPRQLSAADIIAQIHSKSAFFINQMNMKNERFLPPAAETLEKAYADWNYVLDKRNLDKTTFKSINKNFNSIIVFMQSHRDYFIHGDFFPDNCLLDENNDIIITDWQNYQLGSMAEVSFFISIGYDWGIDIKEEAIKKRYCEKLSFYTNKHVSITDLDMECDMSTVFVTYLYWANYLKDSGMDRVKSIFNKMLTAYERLSTNDFI